MQFADVFSELRHAARRLAKRPLLTLVAIALLTLGIGANTAVFSLLEAVVLRDVPLPDPERLVYVNEMSPVGPTNIGFQTGQDLRERLGSLAGLAMFSRAFPVLSGADGEPASLAAINVSASFLPTLGVPPALGRNFTDEEDRPDAARVVMLGHLFWQQRFGGDPTLVGQTLQLDEIPHEVVGVLPAGLDRLFGPGEGKRLDIVRPLRYRADQSWACRTCRHLTALGRLKPGTELAAAQAEIDGAIASLKAAYPTEYMTGQGLVEPVGGRLANGARPLLAALFGGVLLVLALAVANVAALLAVRTLERQRELAIRRSLGADGGTLIFSAWSESLLVAAAGGAAGLALAKPLLLVLLRFAPDNLPRLDGVGLSLPVLAFTATAALLVALAAGIAPALLHRRVPARLALATTQATGMGRERRRGLRHLVMVELALAMAIVFAAFLLGRSFEALLDEDPGFETASTVTARVSANGLRYREDPAVHAFFDQALERIEAIPGVEAAGWTSQLPLSGDMDTYGLRFEDKPLPLEEQPYADRYAITDGYPKAMGLRLAAGRFFEASDRADTEPVLVISRSLAETYWPGEDPLGKRVRLGDDNNPWRRVVGLVENVRQAGLDQVSLGQVYVPSRQWTWADSNRSLVVRTQLPQAQIGRAFTDAIHAIDPSRPVERIASLDQVAVRSTGGRRYAAGLWSIFALLALLLAAIGTYGLFAQEVALRRRELGLRAALGAAPGRLAMQVSQGALHTVLRALTLGLPLIVATGQLLASQLWKVEPLDPLTLAAALTLVTATALLATWLPARRAARVDPATTLRDE